ncbi:hypothetical protein BaRGS_00017281 [Batillaria attramentaria]|uniref:Uncharacterized protein n=1 Tax=Batillaria attramentaria TaxID=370345 RepID=A0ABD0KWG2_9CAEN
MASRAGLGFSRLSTRQTKQTINTPQSFSVTPSLQNLFMVLNKHQTACQLPLVTEGLGKPAATVVLCCVTLCLASVRWSSSKMKSAARQITRATRLRYFSCALKISSGA